MIIKFFKAFSLVLILFFSIEQNSFALNGSYKTFISESQNTNEDKFLSTFTNTFRPKFVWSPNDKFSFYTAYAISANIQSTTLPLNNGIKRTYRAADLNPDLYTSNHSGQSNVLVNQNLDRFYLSYSAQWGNLNIGRAPIAFGSAKIVNPTDVLTPITYQTLDKEERVGVDTIRMNVALGSLSLLDVGYVFGDKLKKSKSAAFVRLKSNYLETDISALLMDFQDNLLIGLDLARSVGKASAWFEAALVSPKYFENNSNNNLKNYVRATIGMDYKLTTNVYSYIEFHYNGAGSVEAKKYFLLQSNTAYTQGGVSLQGVHYLIPGLTYELSSLWKLTAQCLFNANDLSIFNNLALEYNIAQDAFIDLGAYVPMGTKSPSVQKSEFGVYPKILYSSLRLYF